MKKRLRKTDEFWEEVGAVTGHSGKESSKFVKNLGSEYQKIMIHLQTSGIDTENEPVLRNSSELFLVFDEYYRMFYPHGGSLRPALILTESSLVQLHSRYNCYGTIGIILKTEYCV
jgi:hypothetical protein